MKISGGKWKKITKYLLVILVAFAAIFGLTKSKSIMSQMKKFFAAGEDPTVLKERTNNNDGTYKLSLSVTGDADKTIPKVNVIVIVDRSGSMDTQSGTGAYVPSNQNWDNMYGLIDGEYVPLEHRTSGWGWDTQHSYWYNNTEYTGQRYQYDRTATRLQATKAAVDGLAGSLLGYNGKDGNPNDTVEMALVSFATTATTNVSETTNKDTYINAVNGLTIPSGNAAGTNWEDALQEANSINFGDNDPTYVIFFSDGAPTFYNNASGTGVSGSGYEQEPNMSNSYNAATDDAATLASKVGTDNFYTIFAYGTNAGKTYMTNLTTAAGAPSDNNYSASSTAELNDAFAQILENIQVAGIAQAKIDDGTTGEVKISSTDDHGLLIVDEDSYKYTITFPIVNGNKVLLNNKEATVSGNKITWDNGNKELVGEVKNGKFIYTWTDKNDLHDVKPQAVNNNGRVEWDLSEVGVLIDSATYTVSFDVYPSQETYDLIAKIKNETSLLARQQMYEKLPAKVQQYLEHDATYENFTLRTNTNAELSYVDTRVSDKVKTVPFNNLDPVTTTAEKMKIEKEWENAYDTKAETATIVVNQDGEQYLPVIQLTNEKPGTTNVREFFIATGLMRVNKNTGELEILDSGYDYTFSESGADDYNWELVSETVRPMIINGDLTKLIKLDENVLNIYTEDGQPKYTKPDMSSNYLNDGENEYYKIDGEIYVADKNTGVATLKATNYRRSNLNITKEIDGVGAPATDEFTYKLTIKDTGATDNIWFSIKNSDESYDTSQNISGTTKSGDYYVLPKNKVIEGTEITFTLNAGDNIRFTNLTTKTEYTVEEKTMSSVYKFKEATVEYTYGKTEPTEDETANINGKVVKGTIELTNSEYEVKYVNEYQKTRVIVTKDWQGDNEGAEGLRVPVQVQLLAGGQPQGNPVELNKDNNWTYTWTELNRYSNEQTIEYTVEELTNLSPQYEYTETTGSLEKGFVIVNTRNKDDIYTTVPVKKVWDDKNNQDGIRDNTKVTFELYGVDEENAVNSYTFKNGDCTGNECTYEFTTDSKGNKLPKYNDGKLIDYKIVESSKPQGYTATGPTKDNNGNLVITNKHETETTEVSVEKKWVDDNNSQNTRPKTIKVTLLANGSKASVKDAEITLSGSEGNNLTYKWKDLDKFSGGQPIAYTVEEEDITNYTPKISGSQKDGWVITNTVDAIPKNIPVTKVWDDKSNQDGKRPATLEVTITGKVGNENVPGTPKTITLSGSGDTWNGTFASMPTFYNGQLVKYSVSESLNTEGYTLDSERSNLTDESKGFIFTNKHETETTEVSVEKKWVDDNNSQNTRPKTIKVTLLANGSPADVDDAVVTLSGSEGNKLTHKWKDLDKFSGGQPIAYTVEEEDITNYTPKISGSQKDGWVITNTIDAIPKNIPVTKVWDDKSNQDGKRPATLEVTITGKVGNETVPGISKPITLSGSGDTWNETFTNMPTFYNGQLVKYSVSESLNTEGYTMDSERSNLTDESKGFIFTNKYTPETTTVKVKKTWNDEDNQDGLRTDELIKSVRFNLYGSNETLVNYHYFDPSEDCTDNECVFEFTEDLKHNPLPKYAGGKEITYTIKEEFTSPHYSTDDPNDEDGNYEIINTHTPFTTDVVVYKDWNDSNNQDGLRKDVDVILKAGLLPDFSSQKTITKEACATGIENCKAEWNGLQKFIAGNKIDYKVAEITSVPNYTTEIPDPIVEEGDGYNNTFVFRYVVTNTHTPNTVTIPVKKVWEDANNQDGKRKYVKFELLADNTKVAEHTFEAKDCSGNECTFTFITDGDGISGTKLPEFKPGKVGQPIKYTIKETNLPDGYTSTGPTEKDPYTITNTHEPSTITIPVKKVWNDADDQDGIRDKETITFKLYGAGGEIVAEHTFTADDCSGNNCTFEFKTDGDGINGEELPEYQPGAQGQKINYRIEETGNSKEYTASDMTKENGTLVITNTHNPEPTTVKVKKVWEDANNQDGMRKYVTFELYGVSTDTPVASHTFTADDCTGNICTFEFKTDGDGITGAELPKFAPGQSGVPIDYTIKETGLPDGYTNNNGEVTTDDAGNLTITNTHEPELINVPVVKQWVDDGVKDYRPKSITVQLYADKKPVEGKTATITPKTDEQGNEVWEYEFKDLEKYEAGKVGHQIDYTVKETEVPTGYTVTYDDGTIDDGTTIINTANETIKKNIPVEKVWDDLTNIEGIRPDSVSFKLVGRVGDKEVVKPYTTTIYKSEDDTNNTARSWIGEFKDVQVFFNGKLINYTLEEVTMDKSGDRYSVDIQGNDKVGYTVTNTSRPETINFTATKNWNDNDDNDGKRPTEITVQLMNDNTGEKVGEEVVLKAEDWSYTWEDLDQFEPGKQGVKIKYSIVEVSEVEGYTPGDYDYKTNSITNNHEPITISYKVEKIWDDFDNQDGKRPKSITVRLVGKVNGEVVVPEKVQKIDSTNNWTYEFKNLPKYYKKQLIQYTITEDVVDLYETKPITQVNTTEDTKELSNNVTNKHDLIPYDNTGKITVKKIWKDRDNKFNTRPSSITIHLFADGVEIKKAVLNASNNWTYTFTGLNKYKEGAVGVEVVYTITEDDVKGYSSSINGFEITNTMTETEIVPPKTGIESTNNSDNTLFYVIAIVLTTLGVTTITFKYNKDLV